MEKLKSEDVKLVEVSVKDNGVVKIKHSKIIETDNAMYENIHILESPMVIDEDFEKVLDTFKIHVVRDNFMGGTGIMNIPVNMLDKEMEEILETFYTALTITSVKYVGSKRNMVKIKAKLIGVNGDVKPIETGKLEFSDTGKVEAYKFWNVLKNQLEQLKIETIKYLNQTS